MVRKTNLDRGRTEQAINRAERGDINIAFVFGSIARHEEAAGSDVDLMVIGKLGLRKLTGMLLGVSGQIGREINSHVLSVHEFIKRKANREHFITQVLEAPKIFIIGNANDLEAMDG